MFNKKKPAGIGQTKLATLIAHDVHLTGDIEFSNGLRMDGHVTGNVSGRADEQTLLVLSDQGSITGNVEAYDIVVNGTITGDVSVEHFVELQSNARVTGNIRYQQLRMDVGASVEGKLTRRDSAAAVAAAVDSAPVDAAALAGANPVEPENRMTGPQPLLPQPDASETAAPAADRHDTVTVEGYPAEHAAH